MKRTAQRPAGDRLFSPDCELWRIDREMALIMIGGRALLMQLAHPMIAAGVAQHSDFKADPLGRLQRTMFAMWSIGFDKKSRAEVALRRVNEVHERVRGVVAAHEPAFGSREYSALNQELLLWVHATLIESTLIGYHRFIAPLSSAARERYYDDSKTFAELFKIRPEIVPPTLHDFESYMHRMLASDALTVGPTARMLAQDIIYPRPWLLRPTAPLFRLVTVGLLPAKLRLGYGLTWTDRREQRLEIFARTFRTILPLVPRPLRIVPQARRAEREIVFARHEEQF